MGKKKGKKGKSQEGTPSGSQQQASSGDQPPQRDPQTRQPQGGAPAQQPQQSPPPQQQQRGPQGQPQPQQGLPRQQQGPQGHPQPQQGLPRQQQGPQGHPQPQQGLPRQQQGPQGQPQLQQGLPRQQPGPPGHPQPQQGPSRQPQSPQGQQQPWGFPAYQPPQQSHPRHVSPGQPRQVSPGQPQLVPQGQQQPWGLQGRPQMQQSPPQQDPQRGQHSQRGRGRGRGRGSSPQPQYVGQPYEFPQPPQPQYQQPQGPPGQQPQSPPVQQPQRGPPGQQHQQPQQGQQPQRGRGRGRGRGGSQEGVQRELPSSPPQFVGQPQESRERQVPQQIGATAGPSTSRAAREQEGSVAQLSTQISGMQMKKIEAGQGDTQLVPMESKIAVQPGTSCKRRIIVEANHLPLNLGKLTTAIHYDVNLVPDTPKNLLRQVVELFRLRHYGNRYPAFDGRKNLYSSRPLPFGEFIADEIEVRNSDGKPKIFKVEIKFANRVDMTPLQNILNPTETLREALQVVDIVLRSAPIKQFIPVGRSFFRKSTDIIDLGEGMEMYKGFYQSAIRGWKPFLNIDVAHKAFPKAQNLLEALLELLSDRRTLFARENLTRPLSRYQLDTLNSFVRGLKVSYGIPGHPGTQRVFRVNGIDEEPRTKAFAVDGTIMTIERYFDIKKNYRLRYPLLPTLWVGARQREDKILLPLELCSVVESQAVRRKLTEDQTSKMIKVAATNTLVRKTKIVEAINAANYNTNESVREFGFSVGNEFVKLDARVLEVPSIQYAQSRSIPGKGQWRGGNFIAGVTINKWTIVSVDRRPARPDDLPRFADYIYRNAAPCGMNITAQAERPFDQIGGAHSIQNIKKYFQAKKEKNYDVIFVVVPDRGPQYSFVKTAAEINVGCLTQCVKSRTVGSMTVQTAINILLKVNSKLNGTNHSLVNRPPIMDKPCMIMGADVTHPSPEATEIPSVAAVTASHDPKGFQYNICWRLQPPRVEIIEDLEAIVMEQLRYYNQKTRLKPERIIFFRDGVSEGQFEQVRNAEILAIRSACKRLQADGYEPAITFLVVQKRHHTRLFPTNTRDSEDKNFNVPAGTCVDHTITNPLMQDFYLVSHASIQGVAKPTKYCTLWDDNSMSHDAIEQLTYHLCHMFARCNRSVSYPAPTYYAHLAAARAKVYIENERLNMRDLQNEFRRFQIQDVIRKGLPMFFV